VLRSDAKKFQTTWGLSIRTSEVGRGVQYGQEGVFKCVHPHFLVQFFSKFMVCPHGQWGGRVEPANILWIRRGGERGQFFAILCGRPL